MRSSRSLPYSQACALRSSCLGRRPTQANDFRRLKTSSICQRKRDGAVLGFVEKHPNTSSEEHPWKAFEAVCGQGPVRFNPGTMRLFYGAAGKAQALEYLESIE